jgi:hypothetical protein
MSTIGTAPGGSRQSNQRGNYLAVIKQNQKANEENLAAAQQS